MVVDVMRLLCWGIAEVVIGDELSKVRPSIICVVADDLGYEDLSFYGQNAFATPNKWIVWRQRE